MGFDIIADFDHDEFGWVSAADSHPYEDLIMGMIERRNSRRASVNSGLAWNSPMRVMVMLYSSLQPQIFRQVPAR
jgi:hypothetical protein